jgi:hypothetical protein
VLAWGEAKPRRQLSTISERLRIPDAGRQRARAQWPNAGNRFQASAGRVLPVASFDLSFKFMYLTVQLPEVSIQTREELATGVR